MKRYYYDEGLMAFWMANYYGMRFIGESGNPVHYINGTNGKSWFVPHEAQYREYHGKYYIHPDSLPLLEPVIGDLARLTWLDRSKTVREWDEYDESPESALDRDLRVMPIIIQRNGKPFFWPITEEQQP